MSSVLAQLGVECAGFHGRISEKRGVSICAEAGDRRGDLEADGEIVKIFPSLPLCN